MPWPPSEGNADIWEQWIKDYHASSAFNVCQHQIRVKEGSQIVVLHQPIPLPHIWYQKVLEWDCRLGLSASRNAHNNDMLFLDGGDC